MKTMYILSLKKSFQKNVEKKKNLTCYHIGLKKKMIPRHKSLYDMRRIERLTHSRGGPGRISLGPSAVNKQRLWSSTVARGPELSEPCSFSW